MKFLLKQEIHSENIATLEHAMKTVDADAKVHVDLEHRMVDVVSWLMPEEFLVAFVDEDYDARIVEA
jgi:copper chaperone